MNEPSDDRAGPSAEGKTPPRRNFLNRLWRRVGHRLGIVFYVLALAVVAATGWAAYANVIKSGWGSDAAAWMQAAGSISAIVGAAWLANSEARRARRLRRERNEEAAWYVRFTIVQAQFDSQIVASELVNRSKSIDKADVREWRQRAITSATALSVLVNRTDHIHPAVTHVTANAKVLMDGLVADLEELSKDVENDRKPDDALVGQIVAPHRALLELIELYDARMRGITLALDKGRDALPIKDLVAWDVDGN
jgi:hypothetical protein